MARVSYLLKFSEKRGKDNVFKYIVQQIRNEGLEIDTRYAGTNARDHSELIAVVSAKNFDALFRQVSNSFRLKRTV